MSEARIRKVGWLSGRKALRTAIWMALAAYAVYVSSVAMADPFKVDPFKADRFKQDMTIDLFPAVGPLGLHDIGKLPALGRIERGKSLIFERPTPADPREEIACLALNIYFEARGEPDEGKFAVSHVVMNRVASDRFPDTVCEVIRQGGETALYRCQLSWWCDGQSDTPQSQADWELSNEIALNVFWGRSADPTGGALWYHADYVSPPWRRDFEAGPKIGRHIFYRTTDQGTRLANRQLSN